MRSRTRPGSPPDPVVSLDLGAASVHAVRGDRTVLVDSGVAGQESRLLRKLARAGVEPETVSLVVLTHCHPDHAGGAAELSQRLGVPVAVHRDEVEWAETGRSVLYSPVRPFGHLLARVLKPTFPAVTPSVVLDHDDVLDSYGAPLSVFHSPGHTPGSVTLLHRPAGRPSEVDALVGDLLAGGFLRRDRPAMPFLAQDTDQVRESVRALLATSPSRLLFGHGKPATALAALRRFGPAGSAGAPARTDPGEGGHP